MSKIRLARPADLGSVQDVVRSAYSPYVGALGFTPGPMSDDYSALIRAERVHVLERDEFIQAILVLLPEIDSMLLDNVAVVPSAQGRGLGTELISFAESKARARGFRQIRLYTNERMERNICLYERLGYIETDRRSENGFDRVYMTKPLI